MFNFKIYDLRSPDKLQQKEIVQDIWKQNYNNIMEWSEWAEHHPKSANKHRELFHKALKPLITNTSNLNYQDIFDNLSYWAEYVRTFSYRSLPSTEQNFYNNMFMALNAQQPQVTHEWLTPIEFEEQYEYSKSWQDKQRMAKSESTLPYYKIGRKFIRYKRSEIDAWMDGHKVR